MCSFLCEVQKEVYRYEFFLSIYAKRVFIPFRISLNPSEPGLMSLFASVDPAFFCTYLVQLVVVFYWLWLSVS